MAENQSVVEKLARVIRNFGTKLNNGIKSLHINGSYVDPANFDIFGFKLERGSPCVSPGTVVLSHETAERFFGTANPVGKTLTSQELGDWVKRHIFKWCIYLM